MDRGCVGYWLGALLAYTFGGVLQQEHALRTSLLFFMCWSAFLLFSRATELLETPKLAVAISFLSEPVLVSGN